MYKTIKKVFMIMLAFLLVFSKDSVSVSAADDSRSYEIDLTVNGSHEVYAEPGDVLTVVVNLNRTDSDEEALMYAMQDEIHYDPEFFELIDDGAFALNGIEMTDIGLIDEYRAFYLNYLSLGEGEKWEAQTTIGSFQVKVLGDKGSSYLKNKNCKVSTKDGMDSYEVTAQDLLVIVSSECVVKFDSMGGSEVPNQTVQFGEQIECSEVPTRAGYTFTGWYKDIYLTEEWNFENDTVKDNMTLFAGWQTGTIVNDNDEISAFPWWLLIVLLCLTVILIWLFRKQKVRFRSDESQ